MSFSAASIASELAERWGGTEPRPELLRRASASSR
jgi:hypothetical protein